MIRSLLLLVVLLVGTDLPLEAQRQQRSPSPDRGPIETLLSLRTQIGLTPDQIGRLEQIDARMDRQNQPLVTQMMEIRQRIRALGPRDRFTADQQALFDGYVAQARPLMRQISRNNAAAMREVGDILTRPQKAQVAELINERGRNRERSSRLPRLPRRGS